MTPIVGIPAAAGIPTHPDYKGMFSMDSVLAAIRGICNMDAAEVERVQAQVREEYKWHLMKSKEATAWSPMRIESIILREIHMQLKAPFETSFGTVQDRRILLVEVVADGISGWGEVTATESPFYNSETTGTAWHIISDFIAPFVI